MDNRKNIQIKTFESKNIYADIFIQNLHRPNSNAHNDVIVCYQQIGVGTTDTEELDKIEKMLSKLKGYSVPFITLNDKLDFNPSNDMIQYIKMCYKDYDHKSNELEGIIKKIVQNNHFFSSIDQLGIKERCIASFGDTLHRFEQMESPINASKLVNITVKLIYWCERYLKDSVNNIPEVISKGYINPKLIYFGDISHQESYMLLLAAYLGFDVLYFNFEDIETSHWSKDLLTLCQLNKNEHYAENTCWRKYLKTLNSKKISHPSQQAMAKEIKSVDASLTRVPIHSNLLIRLKTFNGQLDSVLSPLSDRAGYVGLPAPILPVYFVRYIGIDTNEDIYNNNLYNMHKKLLNECECFHFFEGTIKIGNYSELSKKTDLVWKAFETLSSNRITELIEYLNGVNVFSFIQDDVLKRHCYSALEKTILLAVNSEEESQISKVKNLVIKLIGWLKDYSADIFGTYSFDKKYNPKVLFYGDIKNHEGMFLAFLFFIGVDILYVNTFKDDVFEALDPEGTFSEVYPLDAVRPMGDFPRTEVMVQHETVALRASEEIAEVIHNVHDGVYLPWQFERYKTMPVTLKTTLEELMILWNEEARIRAGFKVVGETIYVPNLFVKISATHDNLSDYWQTINMMTTSKLTHFYKALPFTDVIYNTRDISSLDLVFEGHERLSFEKLKSHSLYRYSHLSDEIQNQLFDKMCMLIDADILEKGDKELRLKIVYTILNLSEKLLTMIQQFDYPSAIPKLVIYDGEETIFSQSDAITMAFLYALGFDICVLTPTGYNNFELFINNKYYSVFKLPNKQFNLSLPDLSKYSNSKTKGFWSGFFG